MKQAEDTKSGIAERIVEVVKSEDIAVMGMGPLTGMEDAPAGYRPQDLLADAQSMVCFGVPVPRGVYSPASHATEQIWRSQYMYYRRLDTLSLRLAQLLEDRGERAAPVYGCYPLTVNGKGEIVGYVNLIRMSELCGIGTVGRNGLLVHSRYGARLMLGGVLTTAHLPSMRIGEASGPGCPPDCRICIDACPVHAISREGGHVDIMRCLIFASQTPFMSRPRFGILARTKKQAAARLLNQRAFDEKTFNVCSRCILECPLGARTI